MKALKVIVIAVAFLSLGACTKNDANSPAVSGTYKGQFLLTNNNPAASYVPLKGDVTIVLSGNTYSSTRNTNYIPAGGAGTFAVADTTITFTDQHDVYTANFDWNLVLKDTYRYTVKDDSLILVKRIAGNYNFYTYKLKKQH